MAIVCGGSVLCLTWYCFHCLAKCIPWYVQTNNIYTCIPSRSHRFCQVIQEHEYVFGGDFDGDNIDHVGMDYESKYDDFM